jgi:N-acyl homoserine lactone hydrolase
MKIETKELTVRDQLVKIHAISTGLVSVKTRFRETNQKGILAKISFLLDKKFTEWMPIWTWVIEHPEGIFLIDTGENSHVTDRSYFKTSGAFANWLNTTQFKFKVSREEEIDSQLKVIGISPEMITKLILTHLHLDHIDGLKYFPQTEILVHKTEWEKPYGDLPKLYPSWFKPTLVSMTDDYAVFGKSHFLTKSKDLVLIHTPGHTNGHSSVILKTDQCYLLFAGDVVYYEKQLHDNRFAGADVSNRKARETYQKIKEFAKINKLIVLPSHDNESTTRLKNEVPLKLL